ncbi:hypothetical protein CRG98_018998 [Punica granatum]|uniref:Uncharacterized protein n=1 Tax=Punica granatum TaxID=22663 RepID=A0A2I0JW88_PUNGR|nr:hypothetical protein CRG98_018998 [Punica granatum]
MSDKEGSASEAEAPTSEEADQLDRSVKWAKKLEVREDNRSRPPNAGVSQPSAQYKDVLTGGSQNTNGDFVDGSEWPREDDLKMIDFIDDLCPKICTADYELANMRSLLEGTLVLKILGRKRPRGVRPRIGKRVTRHRRTGQSGREWGLRWRRCQLRVSIEAPEQPTVAERSAFGPWMQVQNRRRKLRNAAVISGWPDGAKPKAQTQVKSSTEDPQKEIEILEVSESQESLAGTVVPTTPTLTPGVVTVPSNGPNLLGGNAVSMVVEENTLAVRAGEACGHGP